MSYTKEEKKILTLITEYCEVCPVRTKCREEDCTLYEIEQVIFKESAKREQKKKKKEPEKIDSFEEFYCHNNPECDDCNLLSGQETVDPYNYVFDPEDKQ